MFARASPSISDRMLPGRGSVSLSTWMAPACGPVATTSAIWSPMMRGEVSVAPVSVVRAIVLEERREQP